MKTKHNVFNLIILDESGSMQSIKNPTISGFNEVVQTIRHAETTFPEQAHTVSLFSFNGMGLKPLYFNQPVSSVAELDESRYHPRASTPLYDAMGTSIHQLKAEVEKSEAYNVLVTVITDGEENASREYNGKAIKSLVEELKPLNWTFTYIGANHDVEKFAATLSISNSLSYEANFRGSTEMWQKDSRSRMAFYGNIKDKKNTQDNFFEEGPGKDNG
jgi:hypothetical protein